MAMKKTTTRPQEGTGINFDDEVDAESLKPLEAVATILEFITDHGNVALEGNAAQGLAVILFKIKSDVEQNYRRYRSEVGRRGSAERSAA